MITSQNIYFHTLLLGKHRLYNPIIHRKCLLSQRLTWCYTTAVWWLLGAWFSYKPAVMYLKPSLLRDCMVKSPSGWRLLKQLPSWRYYIQLLVSSNHLSPLCSRKFSQGSQFFGLSWRRLLCSQLIRKIPLDSLCCYLPGLWLKSSATASTPTHYLKLFPLL